MDYLPLYQYLKGRFGKMQKNTFSVTFFATFFLISLYAVSISFAKPPKLPDLVIQDLYLNKNCQVVVKVKNNGPGMVPNEVWTIHTPKSAGVYFYKNGVGWGGASIWKFDPGRSLQSPGGTAIYTSSLKVSGSAKITATVDHWNKVKESREENNKRTEKLTCKPVPQKDLTVKISQCPTKAVKPGQSLDAKFQVIGKSTFPSALKDIAVDIILTSKPTYPSPASYATYSPNYSDGVLLKGGREHISFKGPGKVNVKLNGSNTVPADTPPGIYYLGVVIDAGNKVKEGNEKNNVSFCRIKVVRPEIKEDCISFNPNTTRVKHVNGHWKIVDGSHWMFDFGNKKNEAERALKIIKHYHMNQSCFVGRPAPSFQYLLVSGQAPVGSFPGEDCISFNPNTTQVKHVNGHWKIVDGSHWMFDFGNNESEARQSLAIIKKYGFRYSCFVGRPDPSFKYLRK